MVLNSKIDKPEFGRKILHIMIGIGALLLIIYNIITPFIIFILFTICIILSLLSLRLKIPIVHFFLKNFERTKGKYGLPGRGLLSSMLGSLLALQLFPRNIALASMIILIFADPTSYLIGKAFGKTKSFIDKRKKIEGNIAGFIVSSLLAMFFVHPILAISGALVAMLFESIIIEIQKMELDDNLIIPLVAGTTMFLIVRFFI
jgi:dolichol kinase